MASPAPPPGGLARPLAVAAGVSAAAFVLLLAVTALTGGGNAAAASAPSLCPACAAPLHPPPGVTVAFNVSGGSGSIDLALDDPRVARPAGLAPAAPDQVYLTLAPGGAVVAHWATQRGEEGADPAHAVQHGPAADSLIHVDAETDAAPPTRYTQRYADATYASPTFHHVPLTRLPPGERVFYRVGSEGGGWSNVFSFVAPAPGPRFPFALAVVGDTGQTHNTTRTLNHVREVAPRAVLHVGDYAYADLYSPSGAPASGATPTTHQPRWDAWARLASPLASSTPLIPTVGNHERERDAAGATWQAFRARLAPPGAREGGPFYYSVDVGPVHVAVVDTYAADMGAQRDWLAADLGAVDRAVTPWVVLSMHAPFYSTYASHYREAECVRVALEPTIAAGGVDLVVAGHVHAYERTVRVLNHAPSHCGPPSIVVGTAGNAEGLYLTHVDAAAAAAFPTTQGARGGGCPPGAKRAGDACAAAAPGPYCHPGQAPWSALREASFGFGELTVTSPTRATWTWHRNQDGARVAADSVVLTRGEEACGGGEGAAAAPAPAAA